VWERIWSEDLNERKEEVLVRIWKEKENAKRAKENRNIEKRKIRKKIRMEKVKSDDKWRREVVKD